MKNVIAGTAGHIDHGKTALVRALTGVDTDRLKEEKRRGISIDIGFAYLDLEPDLRVALIDVPGHERFIKNMLAGIGSIDFVVFVISANESVKPQTREHFDICRLLRIPSGVIALTKCDLVDPETLGVVKLEVEDFVKNSFLQDAPIVPVSSVTGQGLKALRAEISAAARGSALRDATRFFRLPVDRSFSLPGFGSIVTGSVLAGSVRPEQEIEAYPIGKFLRVRGVQVHDHDAKLASAGQRCALNVTGVDISQLRRGITLGSKQVFASCSMFDGVLDLLPSAPPLKNRAPIHFHASTAEVRAEVRLMDQSPVLQPGSSSFVRIVLREPVLLLPGDRFIARMFSPVTTIGGGEVLDADPPRRIPNRLLLERARALQQAPLPQRLSIFVAEAPQGLSLSSLATRTGLRPDRILSALKPDVHVFGDWLMHSDTAKKRLAGWRKHLTEFHRSHPLLAGSGKEEMRTRDLAAPPPSVFEALLALDAQITSHGEFVRLTGFRLALQDDEREASARMDAAFAGAGLQAPSVAEVLQSSGVDPARARTLLQILLRDHRLIRFSADFVLHQSAVTSLRELMAERKGRRFSVAEFKAWTGVSRKYAIPLLEWLDRERITLREGDTRIVL